MTMPRDPALDRTDEFLRGLEILRKAGLDWQQVSDRLGTHRKSVEAIKRKTNNAGPGMIAALRMLITRIQYPGFSDLADMADGLTPLPSATPVTEGVQKYQRINEPRLAVSVPAEAEPIDFVEGVTYLHDQDRMTWRQISEAVGVSLPTLMTFRLRKVPPTKGAMALLQNMVQKRQTNMDH